MQDEIKKGNVQEAHRLVELLAKANQKLVIYFMNAQNIPEGESEDENTGGYMLKVKVIDHENLNSNAAVQTYVENLKMTTIEQMKIRVCIVVVFYFLFSHLFFFFLHLLHEESS